MHLTPTADVQDKGLVDQTRGILNWVTENCPDNFHQEVGYATVSPHLHPCSPLAAPDHMLYHCTEALSTPQQVSHFNNI